jgi:hypothetical protein
MAEVSSNTLANIAAYKIRQANSRRLAIGLQPLVRMWSDEESRFSAETAGRQIVPQQAEVGDTVTVVREGFAAVHTALRDMAGNPCQQASTSSRHGLDSISPYAVQEPVGEKLCIDRPRWPDHRRSGQKPEFHLGGICRESP